MYVLIVLLSGMYTTDVIFQEFTTKDRCEVAVEKIKGDIKDVKSLYCLQK